MKHWIPAASAAFAIVAACAVPGMAEVEYVPLAQPCSGKQGLAIVTYTYLAAPLIAKEHLFSEVCMDLTAKRIFAVEISDPFEAAFRTHGNVEYHSYPAGTTAYREMIYLQTDDLTAGVDYDHHDSHADSADLPDPEAPDVVASINWVKGASARPLDRAGMVSSWLSGFVGGAPLGTRPLQGTYVGFATNKFTTTDINAELSGLGFGLSATVTVDGNNADVSFELADHEAGQFSNYAVSLSLRLDGSNVTGEGTMIAENGNLAPANSQVWKYYEGSSVGVTGRILGQSGEHLYVLAIWEGIATDREGGSIPTSGVMELYSLLKPSENTGETTIIHPSESGRSGQTISD